MIKHYSKGIIALALLVSCTTQKEEVEESYKTQVDSLVQLMTLEDKINIIHASSSFTSGGVERLGIPEIVMSDGPHGVRHEHGRDWSRDDITSDSVSYLPTGITLASTWNRELGYQYGTVLGNEAKARGKDMILGPGINIIRTPLCGRNFEYLSEDPYLTAEMGVGYVKGVQDQGISACAKHFVANNQEIERKKVDVHLSEQALREIYMPAFKAVVQDADVNAIMGAYNKLRGQYCTHNEYLINNVLKNEWNFQGLVVSDWSAVDNTKEALLYGTDIEMGTDLMMMPNIDYNKFHMADSALAMVKRGEVAESYVDDKVRRILRVMYKTNMFGERSSGKVNTPEHQQLALKVAEEGIVLLKNENLLPLNKNKVNKVAVIGHNATRKFAEAGGSSQVKALYEITPLEAIKTLAGNNFEVAYAEGYTMTEDTLPNFDMINEAVKVAKDADVVLYFGGWIHNFDPDVWNSDSYDCEGNDKKNLKLLFGQQELINKLAEVNKNMAVIIFGGSNVEMKDWMDRVPSIMQAWYPGMEGGTALANIIFGKTNPSGKLPMTFANSHLDYPAHIFGEYPGEAPDHKTEYKEGILVGYRYFDAKNVEPLFPFGHGLSYTTFEYSNLNVNKQGDQVKLTLDVTNNGNMDGSEVVQVYIAPKNSKTNRASKELKQFAKAEIKAGETKSFELILSKDNFKYFDNDKNNWVLEPIAYEIQVGSSSRDIRLRKEVKW